MLDRTIAPAFRQNNTLEILKAEVNHLPNGVTSYAVIGGLQEVLKIEIIFRAGRWYEEKSGAAHFAANLISKGTASKSSFDIARVFDLYGAHVEINPGLDVVSVALYTLTKNLEPVLALLYEILVEASYPEKELEQSKTIFQQNLKVNQEKTSFQASKLFRKQLFGEGHPYGKELEESVNELSQQDIRNHFRYYFKDAFVLISGRISQRELSLIENTMSRLPFQKSPEKKFPAVVSPTGRSYAAKEGSIQSSIRMGKRFIGRNHVDYPAVLLLSHIVGGYFGSRLMKNIREDKGLTYGIYSSIHTLVNDTYLVIGSDVNKENLDVTFEEIRKELKRLRSETISPEELTTARNHFIGSVQSEITTPFSHADKWKNIVLYNLPVDYYSKLLAKLQQITAADLLRIGEQYFSEDSFLEVAVG
jgi:zinc protease